MKTIAGIEAAERVQGTALVFGKSIKIEQKLEDLGGNKPEVIRTVIPFQLKSLNDEERTIEFIGSSPATDRYGDVIEQNWELGNFLKNPVIPWAHMYHQPPVAKALEVFFKDGNIGFKGQWATADEYDFADTIYKLYKGGYLRAFSVGFIPLEYEGDWVEGYTFTKCELLEVSCVTVPANPEALVLAFESGDLSENERKTMTNQARSLIKALTLSDELAENDDMETAKALSELKEVVTDLAEAVKAIAPVKSADDPEAAEVDEPEVEAPADSEPVEVSEGTEEDVLKGFDAEELKEAVGKAVEEKLDYQLGKIK